MFHIHMRDKLIDSRMAFNLWSCRCGKYKLYKSRGLRGYGATPNAYSKAEGVWTTLAIHPEL